MKIIILLAVFVVIFVWFDTDLNQSGSNSAYTETVVSSHHNIATEEVLPNNTFKCDGRTYCSQMTSCEEAKFFLKNCPNPKMDGNNDGTPCERQWCH